MPLPAPHPDLRRPFDVRDPVLDPGLWMTPREAARILGEDFTARDVSDWIYRGRIPRRRDGRVHVDHLSAYLLERGRRGGARQTETPGVDYAPAMQRHADGGHPT